MVSRTNEVVNSLFRTNSATAARAAHTEESLLTDTADKGLDMAMEGLSALHASIDELSTLTGEAPEDGRAPGEVESAFWAAVDALILLRDEVDDQLVEAGLEPTSADVVIAEGAEVEEEV